ncbi:hypothetical protein Pmani_014857, partial [Petrolisthes manimaculis]
LTGDYSSIYKACFKQESVMSTLATRGTRPDIHQRLMDHLSIGADHLLQSATASPPLLPQSIIQISNRQRPPEM